MCRFKSAIVLQNGDVLHHPLIDSHSELEELFRVRDTMENRTCKVEFYPEDNDDLDKPEKYVLHVDGAKPDWWNEAMAKKAASVLRVCIQSYVAKDNGYFCGTTVLARDKTLRVSHCKVYAFGSSNVVAWGSSNVMARGSSKVEARDSSNVMAWGSSKVVAWDSSNVVAWDSSNVVAWESSKVKAWDSSKVEARGSSKVEARGSSNVVAWDSSKIVDKRKK